MSKITISLDPCLICFYQQIADLHGLSLQQVLSDALFKLAGELSLEALRAGEQRQYPPS